jgi:arginase family enzyme
MWHRYAVLLAFLFGLLGCLGRPIEKNTAILDYADFGPSALASEVLGSEWWQWQPQGDGDPATRYPIKVVVYWEIPLDLVKQAYPVLQEKQQDYRYLERTKALTFLEGAMRDAKDFQLTQGGDLVKLLQVTQRKILPDEK